jgi:hypothetical protein
MRSDRFITAQEVIEKMAQKGQNSARMTLRLLHSSPLSLCSLESLKAAGQVVRQKNQARQYE